MSRAALAGLVAALVAATALACWALLFVWRIDGGGPMTGHGWIALALAVAGAALLAAGLMWLAFRSSRDGWDDLDREP